MLELHRYEPYLVGYSSTEVLCLRHLFNSGQHGRIYRFWQVTIHGYELQDISIYRQKNIVSINVPEFMEASSVWVEIDTGQIVETGSDLYDVSVRYFASNGPGGYLRQDTFLKKS